MSIEIAEALKEPFAINLLHFRVGARTQDKSKGIALAYITSRDAAKRLDDVVGIENWQVRHPREGYCEVGIKLDGEWVWKGDGAGETNVEGEKGRYSDSFKRACVAWGISRYLYFLPNTWVPLTNNGQKLAETPVLPKWAHPK